MRFCLAIFLADTKMTKRKNAKHDIKKMCYGLVKKKKLVSCPRPFPFLFTIEKDYFKKFFRFCEEIFVQTNFAVRSTVILFQFTRYSSYKV